MLYLFPIIAISLGLLAGCLSLRAGKAEIAAGLGGLFLTLFAWALWKDLTTPGLDALIYTGLAWFVLLPGAMATGLGALLGRIGMPRLV